MQKTFESSALTQWFLAEKRELPWRVNPNPYAVWVSEVMLQQTQVSVVIPYFENWMIRFPNIEALSMATLDEVIKAWEGLGYYSRGRNLHAGAKYLQENCKGSFPKSYLDWKPIKGLGPYTTNAIRSFAFHERAAPVDGNVVRVLTRYFKIEEDISSSKTQKTLQTIADDILPEKESWIHSEALIELGAKVCTKKPQCSQCPIRRGCQAYKEGLSDLLPFKSKKTNYEKLERIVTVIIHDEQVLIKRCEKGIMSDLHEFPFNSLQDQLELNHIKDLPSIDHSFTRFRVRLFPKIFRTSQIKPVDGYQWVNISQLKNLAFSSGHRRILQAFLEQL